MTTEAFSLSLRRFDTECVIESRDPSLLSAFAAFPPSFANPYSGECIDGGLTWQLTRVPSDVELLGYGEMLASVAESVTT